MQLYMLNVNFFTNCATLFKTSIFLNSLENNNKIHQTISSSYYNNVFINI